MRRSSTATSSDLTRRPPSWASRSTTWRVLAGIRLTLADAWDEMGQPRSGLSDPCDAEVPALAGGCRRARHGRATGRRAKPPRRRRDRCRRQAAATAGTPRGSFRLTAVVLADDRFDRDDGPEPACAERRGTTDAEETRTQPARPGIGGWRDRGLVVVSAGLDVDARPGCVLAVSQSASGAREEVCAASAIRLILRRRSSHRVASRAIWRCA
jgi:hypothetical protein